MVNEAARLLFTRRQPLFTQNQRFSSHLHQFRKPCLWSRFITLSLHCTCETAPRQVLCLALLDRWSALLRLNPLSLRLWSFRLSAGGCVIFTARLCRLISFISKPIAAEPLSNGIFEKNHIFLNFCSCVLPYRMINYSQTECMLHFRKNNSLFDGLWQKS